jgi:hypothetical protein
MNSDLILFAVEAGVKLGQKLNDVLVSSTFEKPMILPVGELFGNVTKNRAVKFFDEHPELTGTGQPYHGLSQEDQLKAYKTLRHIDERIVGSGTISDEAIDVVVKLQEFRQFEKKFGARPAVQRVIGTVVEIGIDYFVAYPEAIGAKSSERKILQAFVEGLDEVNFAEGTRTEIIGDVLVSSLTTLKSNTTLVSDSARAQALIGGVTGAFLEDINSAGSVAKMIQREDLIQRIGSGVLRGGARAFSENIDLFMPDDEKSKKLVQSTLTNLLAGIKGKEGLFTNESIEVLFDSALQAIAQNAELFSDDALVQDLVKGMITAMTDATGKKVFAGETVAAVLNQALIVTAEHMEVIIDPTNPRKQLLANSAKAIAQSLSGTLAGGGTVKDLLSTRQLVTLTGIVFDEVAKHPEHLLGEAGPGDRKVALAQIIGSIARAIGDEPEHFVNGEGFLRLVRLSLRTASRNVDGLLDLDTQTTRTNLLSKVIKQTADAFEAGDGSIAFLDREVFLDLLDGILPVVSANTAGLHNAPNAVQDAVSTALSLASGSLQGRINGENLPYLASELLTEVLWEELDLNENSAVIRSATTMLRAA